MTARVLLLLLPTTLAAANALGQELPLVYDVEHTGADFSEPLLPSVEDLPIIRPLPDPFMWSDGSGRVTKFDEWSRRRAEIKAEIDAAVKDFESRSEFKPDIAFDHVFSTPHKEVERQRAEFLDSLQEEKADG